MEPQLNRRTVDYPDIVETAKVFTLKAMLLSFGMGFFSSIAATAAWEWVRPNPGTCITVAAYRTGSAPGPKVRAPTPVEPAQSLDQNTWLGFGL